MPWLGLLLSPCLIQRRLRTTYAVQDVCFRTQSPRFRSLPLWSRYLSWSRCHELFPGPFLPSRAQVGLPGLLARHKVPAISSQTASLDPWSWAGRLSFQPALVAPCPASSQSWSICNDLPELPGFPAGPLPMQMTSGLAVKKSLVLPPGAWLFFRQDRQWKPLVLPPAIGSIFHQDQQWKTLCPTPLRLARFFSWHVLLPQHVQRDLPAFHSR